MTRVKICGLTSLGDARHAWHSGADLLGFILVPSSPRYVAPEVVATIVQVLRDEGCCAQLVGVFANERPEQVRESVRVCGLDLAQLHGGESADYVRTLGVPTIVARRVHGTIPWEELAACDAWAYLLDSYQPERLGGTGQAWDWGLVGSRGYMPQRLILAGGLNAENVAQAIRTVHPWGVDAASGVEMAPGVKDALQVARFIANAKQAGLA